MKREEYERMYLAEESQWWYAGMRQISLSLLDLAGVREDDAQRRILDAGCGTGSMLGWLGRRGAAVGIDLSEEALRFSRERGVAVARAGLLSLPFSTEQFDSVTSFDVIYHGWVRDDRAAVAELVRVLRPGGVLLLRVPALACLYGAHDEAVHTRHRYSRPELRRLLEGAGLDLVRVSYANSFLFPLLLVRRTLDRLLGRSGSDVGFLPAPLEYGFGVLLRLEARLIRLGPLPIGASLFALARKPS